MISEKKMIQIVNIQFHILCIIWIFSKIEKVKLNAYSWAKTLVATFEFLTPNPNPNPNPDPNPDPNPNPDPKPDPHYFFF